jgi:hypothetical protein
MGETFGRARCPRPNANTRRTTASRPSTPASKGPVRQPARSPREKPAGIVGRRTQREGDRDRERKTPAGHQARGGDRSAGQPIGLGRIARHQDADRHAAPRHVRRSSLGRATGRYRPSGRPLRGLLRMRLSLHATDSSPRAEERSPSRRRLRRLLRRGARLEDCPSGEGERQADRPADLAVSKLLEPAARSERVGNAKEAGAA